MTGTTAAHTAQDPELSSLPALPAQGFRAQSLLHFGAGSWSDGEREDAALQTCP